MTLPPADLSALDNCGLDGLSCREMQRISSENEKLHDIVQKGIEQVEKIVKNPDSRPEDCETLPLDSTIHLLGDPSSIDFPDLLPGRKTCYFMMAVKLRDASLCDTFSSINAPEVESDAWLPSHWVGSNWFFDDHTERYIFGPNGNIHCKAKVNQFVDIDQCNSMSDKNEIFGDDMRDLAGGSYLKSFCIIKTVAQVKNVSICDTIREPTNETYQKDVCYSAAADALKSSEFCSKIKDKYDRSDCLTKFAKIENDAKHCQTLRNIVDDRAGDDCLKALARETKDGKFCESVRNSFDKDSCYNNIAGLTKDFTFCHPIQDFRSKDTCLYWLAQLTHSRAPCGQMTPTEYKGRCLAIN